MEKYTESLKAAEKYSSIADQTIYVMINLLKEKKLLFNALENVYKSVLFSINSVLQFENSFNRTVLYQESSRNLQFFRSIASDYDITPYELGLIDEIISLVSKHKKSPLEFTKGEKIVIMEDSGLPSSFDEKKVKSYVSLSKSLTEKIKKKVNSYSLR